jgi:Ca2+-transporting ATPase
MFSQFSNWYPNPKPFTISCMQYLSYTSLTGEEALLKLDTSNQGLTSKEVAERLGKYGKNQTKGEQVSWISILLRQFKSPFSYLLIGAFVITLLLGESIDALMILLFVLINTILGFIQEYRSEKTVSLLNKYLEHKTKVIRAGNDMIVASTDIVPGDIVLLEPGDIVPCDIRILESFNMSVDESVLTGESAASYKSSESLSHVHELYEAKNICFGGTTILTGDTYRARKKTRLV